MNIYKEFAPQYFMKGYTTIPDKFKKKLPAIKGWNKFSYQKMSKDEMLKIADSFTETNISVNLGQANNLCIIDVDTTDTKIVEFLAQALPQSPVERIGSKGFVRFFRPYPGFNNYMLKDSLGNNIMEVLGPDKKVTIPPSIHPAGMQYKWTDKSLLDVENQDLPMIPPMLIANLEMMLAANFPDKFGNKYTITPNKTGTSYIASNGRTDTLKKKAMQLIAEMDKGKIGSISNIANTLYKFDLEEHGDNALFNDLSEQSQIHTHGYTNALKFTINMVDYVQGKRFKENKMYTTILNGGFITEEEQDIYKLGLQYKEMKNGNIKKIKKDRVRYEFE